MELNNFNDDDNNVLLLSEFTIARFYAATYNDNQFVFCGETKTWYLYNDFNVLKDLGCASPFLLKNLISGTLTEHFTKHPIEHNDKVLRLVGSSAFTESVMSYLKGFVNDANLNEKIDTNTNLIAFNNGVLYDIQSNTYRSIEKTDYISKTMSIPYIEIINGGKIVEMHSIINTIFEDEIVSNYFLKVLGLALFTNKFEKLNILTGVGRNGKSLIMNFLGSILKDYSTTAESDFLTSKMRNGISCSLVKAKNTRLLLLSEPSNDDYKEMKLNNALIKSITGNDDITARALYKNSETFKPTFNTFLLCNEIPNMEKVEYAMIERLNIIKFKLTFTTKNKLKQNPNNRLGNPDLKNKMSNDEMLKCAFMQILIDTAFENINKPFKTPAILNEFKNDYIEEIDVVKQFLDENVIKTNEDKDKIKTTDFYIFFKTKAASDICARDFYKSVERNGILKTKYAGVYYFKSIRLKTVSDNVDFNVD